MAALRREGMQAKVRCIDPSYSIRGLARNTGDAILCEMLAAAVLHTAFAGRTGLIIGTVQSR